MSNFVKSANNFLFFFFISIIFIKTIKCQTEVYDTQYRIIASNISYSCGGLSNSIVFWKFKQTGSLKWVNIANLAKGIPHYDAKYNTPEGKIYFQNNNFVIKDLTLENEGIYFCEALVSAGSPMVTGVLNQLVIRKIPEKLKLDDIEGPVLTENTTANVARCFQKAGKPASNLTWYNGTKPILQGVKNYVRPNKDNSLLTDTFADLSLNVTLYDHQRNFTCRSEHVTLKEAQQVDYLVKIKYSPRDVRIWANTTKKEVYCEADSFPNSTFDWIIPTDNEIKNQQKLLISDLMSMPGYHEFQCTADNGVGKPVTTWIIVDDLRYPNGKPSFLGLAHTSWYIIAGIAGGLLLLLFIICCCCCCRKKKKNKKKTKTSDLDTSLRYGVDVSLQPVGEPMTSSTRYDNDYSMKRSPSLESLVEQKLKRAPSREELDQVAGHMQELLSKSWDNLARSRDQLNRSRYDVTIDEQPPHYKLRDDNPRFVSLVS